MVYAVYGVWCMVYGVWCIVCVDRRKEQAGVYGE